ncbi:MAG: hypothetical protein ACXACF_01540 [Candidatus Hermodarchaeia archaeon]|jgi:hypothetical protein
MTKLKEHTKETTRQKKFVKELAKTGEIGKSALKAGYKDSRYGSQLMMNEKILTALQMELEALDVNKTLIVRKIKQGLNATRVIRDGGKKYPDFHARHKFLDMLLKVRGDYAPEKHQIEEKKITIVITPETLRGLRDSKAITDAEIEELEREVS